MLNSIEIKNFKKINDTLILNSLSKVNYLVGQNGCGKSSVLTCLQAFSNNIETDQYLNGFGDIRKVVSNDSLFVIDFNNQYTLSKNKKIEYSLSQVLSSSFYISVKELGIKTNQLSEDNIRDRFYNSLYLCTGCNSNDEKIITRLSFDLREINTNEDFLIEYLNEDVFSDIKVTKIYRSIGGDYSLQYDYVDKVNSNISGSANLLSLSSGNVNLISLYIALLDKISKYDRTKKPLLVTLEEPEFGLHPDFQKKIPKLLDRIIKQTSVDIYFFVSTHSPFIISAAAEFDNSQKVYMLYEGKNVGLDFCSSQRLSYKNYNSLDSQNGYTGGECLLTANKMLGAGIQDFLPHTLYFAEDSLCELVKSFANRGDINGVVRKPLFIPTKGDSETLKNAEISKSIYKSYSDYIKNGYIAINESIKAIIDENNECKTHIAKLKKEYGDDSVIVIQAKEQELLYPLKIVNEFLKKEGYPEWDGKKVFKTHIDDQRKLDAFVKKHSLVTNNKKGALKSYLGRYVGSKMTKEEFEKLSPELSVSIFGDKK